MGMGNLKRAFLPVLSVTKLYKWTHQLTFLTFLTVETGTTIGTWHFARNSTQFIPLFASLTETKMVTCIPPQCTSKENGNWSQCLRWPSRVKQPLTFLGVRWPPKHQPKNDQTKEKSFSVNYSFLLSISSTPPTSHAQHVWRVGPRKSSRMKQTALSVRQHTGFPSYSTHLLLTCKFWLVLSQFCTCTEHFRSQAFLSHQWLQVLIDEPMDWTHTKHIARRATPFPTYSRWRYLSRQGDGHDALRTNTALPDLLKNAKFYEWISKNVQVFKFAIKAMLEF